MKLIATSVLAVAALTASIAQAPTTQAQEPKKISWLSTGDSYSSGEGVRGNVGECAQSREQAWGPRAAQLLRDDYGWEIDEVVFTACTGHLAEDQFNQTPDGKEAGLAAQWDWGTEQPGFPENGRFDVITMSYGGNDIGFSDLIMDCIAAPAVASDANTLKKYALGGYGLLVATPVGDVVPFWGDDCDAQEGELRNRIDWLFDPNPCGVTGVRRSTEFDNFACEIVIDAEEGLTGSLTDFWIHMARNHLTTQGQLVVQGYPALFAESAEWGLREKLRCNGVTRGDANMLGRLSEFMDDKFREAVNDANEQLGHRQIIYSSVHSLYRGGGHSLCGNGEDWLNGMITLLRDKPRFVAVPVRQGPFGPTLPEAQLVIRIRHLGAFHPKAIAHEEEAKQVAALLSNSILADVVEDGISPCLVQEIPQQFDADRCNSTASLFARALKGEDVSAEVATDEALNGIIIGPFDNSSLLAELEALGEMSHEVGWVQESQVDWEDWQIPDSPGCAFYDGLVCFVDLLDPAGQPVAQIRADYYGNGLTGFVLNRNFSPRPLTEQTTFGATGFGPIEFGMTLRDADFATTLDLNINRPTTFFDEYEASCYFIETGIEGAMLQVVNDDAITRGASATRFDPAIDPDTSQIYTLFVTTPATRTTRGAYVGMGHDELRELYDNLEESDHEYSEGWSYLDVVEPDGRGLRFEVSDERVQSIQAGFGYSLLEGCS